MEYKVGPKAGKNKKDLLWALGLTLAVAGVAVLAGGFYYALNDDVLIKDILSGVYTGEPEGRTMQLLYPLGFLLSLLYRILRLPVFGLFLCLCQFGCVYLICLRVLSFCTGGRTKLLACILQAVFWIGLFLSELVFVQYTVTAGMLATAAVFWMLTADEKESPAAFWKENLPALLLYWTAFNLRSEMGLLLLPLAGACGLCRWHLGGHGHDGKNLLRYPGLFGLLALGLLFCQGMESFANRGDGWQEFKRFFDARTEVYDYRMDVVRNYEENREIYEGLGISPVRQVLLENYNFGVDDGMDAAFMEALAKEAAGRGSFFSKSLRESLWELLRGHFLSREDFGANVLMLLAGALLFAYWLGRRGFRYLWHVPLLLGVCSILWLFILLRGRMLPRISVPLYLAATAGFVGLLLAAKRRVEERETALSGNRPSGRVVFSGLLLGSAALAILLVGGISLPGNFREVRQEAARREKVNEINREVLAYCRARQGVLFLEDVYSTVDFTEKVGRDWEKPFNYDLLGGWLVKSPLTAKKLAAFGFSSMGEALKGQDNVRILTEKGSSLDWLEAYFAECGLERKAVLTDTIARGEVEVYQMVPMGERIEGAGIYLRPIEAADTEAVVRWRNSERVKKNFIWQADLTAQGHEQWLRTKVATGEVVQFIICQTKKDRPVGSVYFRDIDRDNKKAEYGIFIGEEDATGQGIGSETARLAVAYAREKLGLHKLMLRVFADNTAAIASYKKAGFVQEAYLKDEICQAGKYRDLVLMAVIFASN